MLNEEFITKNICNEDFKMNLEAREVLVFNINGFVTVAGGQEWRLNREQCAC